MAGSLSAEGSMAEQMEDIRRHARDCREILYVNSYTLKKKIVFIMKRTFEPKEASLCPYLNKADHAYADALVVAVHSAARPRLPRPALSARQHVEVLWSNTLFAAEADSPAAATTSRCSLRNLVQCAHLWHGAVCILRILHIARRRKIVRAMVQSLYLQRLALRRLQRLQQEDYRRSTKFQQQRSFATRCQARTTGLGLLC